MCCFSVAREDMFYERLWKKMAPYALETILMEASQAECVTDCLQEVRK